MQTYEDAMSLRSALEDLILAFSGRTDSTEELIKANLSPNQVAAVEGFLKESVKDQSNREEIVTALKALQQDLEKVKPVDMEIAVEPDEDLKDAVMEWFSANLPAGVLPRYSVNRVHLGGMKITYNGIYLDLSLRRKIDELSILKRKI